MTSNRNHVCFVCRTGNRDGSACLICHGKTHYVSKTPRRSSDKVWKRVERETVIQEARRARWYQPWAPKPPAVDAIEYVASLPVVGRIKMKEEPKARAAVTRRRNRLRQGKDHR